MLVDRGDDGSGTTIGIARLPAILGDHAGAHRREHRPIVRDALFHRFADEARIRLGTESAGLHGEYLDSERRHFLAQHLCQPLNSEFGRGVEAEARDSDPAGDRRHVDDPSAPAAAHAGQHGAGEREN